MEQPETITISKAEYEEYQSLKQRNEHLLQQVDYLMQQMRLARQKKFGSSSEKSEYDQLGLFDEAEVSTNETVPEPDVQEIKSYYRKKRKEIGEKLPKDLPIEIVEHTLPEEEQICAECGGHLHVMGKTERDTLKLIPAQAVIEKHISYTYSCRHCERHGETVPVVKAAMDVPLIKGSIASAEAVAQIAAQKFVMASPLYRQQEEWNRQGIPLSRQTMSNWLIRCTEEYLAPVYDCLREKLVNRVVLHADETVLQVLREEGKTPQSKSHMWLYRTSGDAQKPIILYEYQRDRKAERPMEFLKEFHGYLHADGYAGYHKLEENTGILVIGCWAHARRKFDEALKGLSEKARAGSLALRAKQYCDKLFALEREFSELTHEERLMEREKRAKPLMQEFFSWLGKQKISTKSVFGNAANYVLGQKKYLSRYLLDGRLEISNNRAERSIRPFVIGRKNFLFANTPRGAQTSAILYSIVETAKESGLDPYAYLLWVFKNAPGLHAASSQDVALQLLPECAPEECKARGGVFAQKGYAWEER